MKHTKRFFSLLIISVIFLTSITPVYAFDRDKHDKYMLDVLFKDFKNVENDSNAKDEIEALEVASYLTIDQYNGHGDRDLMILKQYGVKNVERFILGMLFINTSVMSIS